MKKLKAGLYVNENGMLFYINGFQSKCTGERYLFFKMKYYKK